MTANPPVFEPALFAGALWRVDADALMAAGFNIGSCPQVIQDKNGHRYVLARVRPYGFDALYKRQEVTE